MAGEDTTLNIKLENLSASDGGGPSRPQQGSGATPSGDIKTELARRRLALNAAKFDHRVRTQAARERRAAAKEEKRALKTYENVVKREAKERAREHEKFINFRRKAYQAELRAADKARRAQEKQARTQTGNYNAVVRQTAVLLAGGRGGAAVGAAQIFGGFLGGRKGGEAGKLAGSVKGGLIASAVEIGFQAIAQAAQLAARTIKHMDQSLKRMVESARRFNGQVASAAARGEVSILQARIAQSQRIGPELSAFTEKRAALDVELIRLETEFYKAATPFLNEGLQNITTILNIASTLSEIQNDIIKFTPSIISTSSWVESLVDNLPPEALGFIGSLLPETLKAFLKKLKKDDKEASLAALPLLGINPKKTDESVSTVLKSQVGVSF